MSESENENNFGQFTLPETESSLFHRKKKLIFIIIAVLIVITTTIIIISVIFTKKTKPTINSTTIDTSITETTTISTEATTILTTSTDSNPTTINEWYPTLFLLKRYEFTHSYFQSMVIVDVNEDNHADIVIGDRANSHLIIFLNSANNQFNNGIPHDIDFGICYLFEADMNNDNKIDFIGFQGGSSTLMIIIYNTGNGTFNRTKTLKMNSKIKYIDLADINQDNYIDIVVVYSGIPGVYIVFNMANGNFSNETRYEMKDLVNRFKVLNIHDNQRFNLILGYNDGNVSILFGNHNKSFIDEVNYSPESLVHTILLNDIDNDNNTDIIIGNRDRDFNFQILFKENSDTFYQSFKYPVELDNTFLIKGDLNNDQQSDIILGHNSHQRIGLYFNVGNRTFINSTIYSTDFEPQNAQLVDINNDGHMEIILIGTDSIVSYIEILSINP
ncbi:unnamed protein product [Adineta steineri]|uniref:Uncharacterized protein n=2 Tax=Adineta steineri TaxID=433720 RepID=A0A819L4N4_9BILA|nr:unnamed protein product [Adineta steineri]